MNSNAQTANRIALVVPTAMLLACAWVASSAFADEPRTEVVKFQDLNVNTPAGVQALYGRIHSAAKRVCSESDPILKIGAAACAKKAEADAIQSARLPQLTAFYKMKMGDHAPLLSASR
jgi:UrcA family protein